MQGASCTQRKVSMVSFGRISPNSFLSSILLVVVIIVTVVIVMVILIVVVVAIVGVVIVVAIFGVVVVFDGWAYAFHQDKASLVRVPVANVTLTSLAHLLRENTDSVRSNQRMRSTAPFVPLKYKALRGYGMIHNDEDGDSDANDGDDDEREIS
ncbi:hypothetical protein Tco_0128024 [Tanacetum coccineum]